MGDTFIVIDVGCIECGESTHVVGVFHSAEIAQGVADALDASGTFSSGQHAFEVHKLSPVGEINPDYVDRLTANGFAVIPPRAGV